MNRTGSRSYADVSDSDLLEVVDRLRRQGARTITLEKQADGTWTIIWTDDEPADEPVAPWPAAPAAPGPVRSGHPDPIRPAGSGYLPFIRDRDTERGAGEIDKPEEASADIEPWWDKGSP